MEVRPIGAETMAVMQARPVVTAVGAAAAKAVCLMMAIYMLKMQLPFTAVAVVAVAFGEAMYLMDSRVLAATHTAQLIAPFLKFPVQTKAMDRYGL